MLYCCQILEIDFFSESLVQSAIIFSFFTESLTARRMIAIGMRGVQKKKRMRRKAAEKEDFILSIWMMSLLNWIESPMMMPDVRIVAPWKMIRP